MRFTEAAHQPQVHKYVYQNIYQNKGPFFYSLGYKNCSTNRNTNTLQRDMEGRNEGGGKKERVSTGFSRNGHFYKNMGKQEGRGLMLADALQREKREREKRGGAEEKVKNIM